MKSEKIVASHDVKFDEVSSWNWEESKIETRLTVFLQHDSMQPPYDDDHISDDGDSSNLDSVPYSGSSSPSSSSPKDHSSSSSLDSPVKKTRTLADVY